MCSGRGLHYGPKVALGDEESQSDSRGKAIQCKGISCILKNGHLSGELDFVLNFVERTGRNECVENLRNQCTAPEMLLRTWKISTAT